MKQPTALVWLPADHRLLGSGDKTMPFLVLGDKYARAVKVNAHAQAVMFPLAQAQDIPALLHMVDGVMLTGSPSNVHPVHYGKTIADTRLPLDEARDALTLALVSACLAEGVPLLGICRGFQEINVALGGTLHQQVHALEGMQDHRESAQGSYEQKYAPSHDVHFEPDSAFARWAGADTATVNSLHGQGIDLLAQGLRALGRAGDGLVEAFEVRDAKAFAYAVQWHPEWCTSDSVLNSALFQAFGEACADRHRARCGQPQPV